MSSNNILIQNLDCEDVQQQPTVLIEEIRVQNNFSLKNFQNLKKIGTGGNATVFRAEKNQISNFEDLEESNSSALKKTRSMPSDKIRAFQSEANILASCQHPNIIQFKQAWLEEKQSPLSQKNNNNINNLKFTKSSSDIVEQQQYPDLSLKKQQKQFSEKKQGSSRNNSRDFEDIINVISEETSEICQSENCCFQPEEQQKSNSQNIFQQSQNNNSDNNIIQEQQQFDNTDQFYFNQEVEEKVFNIKQLNINDTNKNRNNNKPQNIKRRKLSENVELVTKKKCCEKNSNFNKNKKQRFYGYIETELCESNLQNFIQQRNQQFFQQNNNNNVQQNDQQQYKQLLKQNTIEIAKQIIEALTYLKNKHNYAHLDLKPQNIFLKNAYNLQVKLGDFGNAKTQSQFQEIFSKNKSLLSYTQGYAPPEFLLSNNKKSQNQKHQQSDNNIDIFQFDLYSLGTILLELFYPVQTTMEMIHILKDFKNKNNTSEHTKNIIYPEILPLIQNLLSADASERGDLKSCQEYFSQETEEIAQNENDSNTNEILSIYNNNNNINQKTKDQILQQQKQDNDDYDDQNMIKKLSFFRKNSDENQNSLLDTSCSLNSSQFSIQIPPKNINNNYTNTNQHFVKNQNSFDQFQFQKQQQQYCVQELFSPQCSIDEDTTNYNMKQTNTSNLFNNNTNLNFQNQVFISEIND